MPIFYFVAGFVCCLVVWRLWEPTVMFFWWWLDDRYGIGRPTGPRGKARIDEVRKRVELMDHKKPKETGDGTKPS